MKKPSLNHRYRLIWSRIQHAWVAVAEHIKSDGKKATTVRDNAATESAFKSTECFGLTKKTQLALIVASALFGASQNVYAQWTDLTIQSGQATTQQQGNHLDVNVSTANVIGTASSLDIAANESVNVRFAQGGGNGLFRSTGNSATNIMGGLTSNGNLFLINQNGVLFGQGAQVNVGSLVASTMNINDADFLSGHYQFNANGSNGSVTNLGTLKVSDGGYLVLLGKHVTNNGILTANNGSVVMGAADSAVLDFYGNGLVKANLSGDALEAVVTQSGNIQADGGAVQLATNSRSSAVNVSGLVQANSLVERNGVISLEGGDHAKVAVSGTLRAAGNKAGTTGGNIEVIGEQVALLGDAKLDASGDAGGGQILVGGDYQGKNEQVYSARTTYVDQNTSINVDANQTGNGGKAIVWADDTTRYYGDISAKGGAVSGDGGFVEVSGKKNLGFNGAVDVSAENGKGGKVLLDPENIVLNNSTQAAPTNNPDGTPDIAFADAPDPGTTTVQINDVRGFSELHLQATNDITVANTLSMNTDNSVLLEANNNIHVNAEISTRGTGGITLNADNNVNLNGRLNSYGSGAINVTADADSSGTGDINVNQRVFARTGGINLTGANVLSATTAGYVQTQGLVGQDSSNINISASNAINMVSNIISTGRNSTANLDGVKAGNVNLTAAGAITVNNISAYGGNGGTGNTAGGGAGVVTIQSTGAGDINTGTLNARNGAARGAGTGGAIGSINVTNTSGDIDTKNLYVHGNTNGNAGDINLTATDGNITSTGNVYASGGGTAAGSTSAGGNGGNINMSASGDVSVTSRIYAQGAGVNGANTAAGGNGGSVNISGVNLSFGNVVYAYGQSGRGADSAGGDGGTVSLNATGAITASNNIYAYGGNGATGGNADAGNAGNITIKSTGAGDISTGNVHVANGAARGTGTGGATGTIIINNSNGNIATKNLYAHGNLNGNAGKIDVDAAAGEVTVTGVVYAYGGTTAAGSTAAGGTGGDVDIDASGDVKVTNRIYAQGGGVNAANAAAGGKAGTVDISGKDLIFGNVVYAYGSNGRGLNQAGGNGGAVNLNATGAITASNNVYAYGGSGATGAGSNANSGNAGAINLTSTSVGDISIGNVNARAGAARGTGTGGTTGTITINNSNGNINTKSLAVQGNTNGHGGKIDIDAAGDVKVTGYAYAQGGGTAAGSTAAGGNGGIIDIDASGDVSVTSHVYVQGAAANGANTAVGGNGGTVNINGDNLNFDKRIYAYGNTGRGANQKGGDGGAINLNATGAVTAKDRVYAYGGTGGGNNDLSNTAAGGNAGSVNISSTGAGDITLQQDVNVRTGYSRGSAAGATAGSIDISNADGNITTKNIRAEGQNHGDGSNVTIDAGTTGDVNVNGVIYTYGDRDAVNTTFEGTDAGDITIKGANTTVTNTINADGGRGRGVNQIGGNAGNIDINASGSISTKAIAANGGNAGSGAGSEAAGGNAGDVSLHSTGTGDITVTTISARTGYTRGNTAKATGAGSVTIENDDGKLTATSISTRGQRRGVGGDVLAISAGDFNVTTVDARASNLTAVDDGDITVGTKITGNTTVTNVLTSGRWLVYSGDPRNDTIGAFKSSADFKQYNVNYGGALLNAGDGFVYRFAPTITTSLTGAVTKPYDGNITASIVGLTLNQTGGSIDGDVINISALASATYDNKNVGTGKAVTSNALTFISGSNGATTVYGYQVDAATGNVGSITESLLSIAEGQAEAAASNPRNSAGLGGLVDVTNQQQFLAVFDVDATAAGGDIDAGAETCDTNADKKLNNPNTSLMLNFGVNLPAGVKKTCISS